LDYEEIRAGTLTGDPCILCRCSLTEEEHRDLDPAYVQVVKGCWGFVPKNFKFDFSQAPVQQVRGLRKKER
jgi:hypothetical protein